MDHLIADSGIQFITREVELNPSEPLLLPNGKMLSYAFVETVDFLDGVRIFNLLYHHEETQKYIPVDELQSHDEALKRRTTGREELDEAGMFVMDEHFGCSLLTTYPEDDEEIFTVNSLQSFRVTDPKEGHGKVSAFELLLDHWLPMPMFRKEIDGVTSNTPMGWCRMKMQRIGPGEQKGHERFRLVWAFDTQTAEDPWSLLRPYVAEEDHGSCGFSLCNRADYLLEFLASRNADDDGNEDRFHAVSDYVASLLGIQVEGDHEQKYKGFYIYFLNYIRLCGGAPEVTLNANPRKSIDVDLVLDIGNSRTCGILFEEGEFTKGNMLEMRDLTCPWICYENRTFDMRVVFRKADFGNDIVLDEDLFQWKSMVRIGEEARRLLYRSLEEEGLSEKTTHHSSPKRYLWDHKPWPGQWENLITTDDPFNVLLSSDISTSALSTLFDKNGNYNPQGTDSMEVTDLLDIESDGHHYSRASLMTFAFIEIFQHALAQINSIRYREKWGNLDVRRNIRNVIITCPTAMPLKEQVTLRQSAVDAFDALTQCTPHLQMPAITPSPEALKVVDPYAPASRKVWKYDEATCCQLVYLYAEIAQRYSGEIHKFFELKGHVRPEQAAEGYEGKSLTIGTLDIGAGTSDIMICSYRHDGNGHSKITPKPLFWDSFYLAGDDILRNLVQNLVIEGKDHGMPDLGHISGALTARIVNMSDAELKALPCLDNMVYRSKVSDICTTADVQLKLEKKTAFASNLIHDFFGADSSMMGFRDRRCRNDFNTQVSVPIAQKMLELLRTHRPSRLYTFEELFADNQPADYLLNYFAHHFGFRFEELNWRYDPNEVAELVKSTMEPLLKQLALVFYAHHCDILLLAGRPTSLDAITELFIKYVPVSPDRLIRLNDYRVGSWFPTADGQGYFYDQKSIVAVGGMVGYAASHNGLKGLVIDFDLMIKEMVSTANYVGEYDQRRKQVNEAILTPTQSSATLTASVFPVFLGVRQLDAAIYQARPLYAIHNHGKPGTLEIRLSRNGHEDKEAVVIEEATDADYHNRKKDLELVMQSLADDGKCWLDKGEFELTIK